MSAFQEKAWFVATKEPVAFIFYIYIMYIYIYNLTLTMEVWRS